jgi:hypothetical protein
MVEMTKHQELDYIVTGFRNYLKTSDDSYIEGIPKGEMVRALNVYSSSRGDRESGWYKAIERRLAQLDDEERYRRRRKDIWKDRGIGIIIGVVCTVIGGIILWFILPN